MPHRREVWRPIAGWPGYQVSDLGRVRGRRGILAQRADRHGYMTVTLRNGQRRKTARVHVLVAETFLPPRPPGMQVRHLDGRQWRNQAANLAWGTQADNEADKASSLRTSVRRRNLRRTETRSTAEYEPDRDLAAATAALPGTLRPGQMPVSAQDAPGAETGLATDSGGTDGRA